MFNFMSKTITPLYFKGYLYLWIGMVAVGIAIATAGVIVGAVGSTGLSTNLIIVIESVAKDNVILQHKNLFAHVDKKMQKLKLGLKSYRYFDQAKELADKLGVVLNESILDAHSSMALSIYSPSNLADLLTDEVEQTRDEKIAIAKQLLQEQQNSLN